MKFKKLLKVLSPNVPISLGISGSFIGSFEDHGSIPSAYLDHKVEIVWLGAYSDTGRQKFNVTLLEKSETN